MVCHGGVVGSSLLALLAPVLVAGIVVVLAPRLARWPALERFEAGLGERIVRWHRPRTIALFGELSSLGSSTLVTLVATTAALAFAMRGDSSGALAVALAPAVAGPLGTLLKKLTRRTRPNEPAGALFRLVDAEQPYADGHRAVRHAGARAARAAASGRRAARVAAVAALLVIVAVGVSRVLLRVHHPSDVVAGYALGAAVVVAVAVAMKLSALLKPRAMRARPARPAARSPRRSASRRVPCRRSAAPLR